MVVGRSEVLAEGRECIRCGVITPITLGNGALRRRPRPTEEWYGGIVSDSTHNPRTDHLYYFVKDLFVDVVSRVVERQEEIHPRRCGISVTTDRICVYAYMRRYLCLLLEHGNRREKLRSNRRCQQT